MAGSVSKQYMTSLVVIFFFISTSSSLSATSHSCDTVSPEEEASSFSYVCHSNIQKCHTFAIIRANSLFNSLSNLSYHLGLEPFEVAEVNEFVPQGQLLLIPIDCRCNGRIFEAHLIKACAKGETFRSVSESLQGLTTCLSIREKNPEVSEDKLDENVKLRLAIRCSCPEEGVSNASFLVTYPVSDRDSISSLAVKFNTTEDAIVSANNKSGVVPLTPALIPLDHKPEKPGSRNVTTQKKKTIQEETVKDEAHGRCEQRDCWSLLSYHSHGVRLLTLEERDTDANAKLD